MLFGTRFFYFFGLLYLPQSVSRVIFRNCDRFYILISILVVIFNVTQLSRNSMACLVSLPLGLKINVLRCVRAILSIRWASGGVLVHVWTSWLIFLFWIYLTELTHCWLSDNLFIRIRYMEPVIDVSMAATSTLYLLPNSSWLLSQFLKSSRYNFAHSIQQFEMRIGILCCWWKRM